MWWVGQQREQDAQELRDVGERQKDREIMERRKRRKGEGKENQIVQERLDIGFKQCHKNLASLWIHLCGSHSAAT